MLRDISVKGDTPAAAGEEREGDGEGGRWRGRGGRRAEVTPPDK